MQRQAANGTSRVRLLAAHSSESNCRKSPYSTITGLTGKAIIQTLRFMTSARVSGDEKQKALVRKGWRFGKDLSYLEASNVRYALACRCPATWSSCECTRQAKAYRTYGADSEISFSGI